MTTIRIGVLGCGRIAQAAHLPAIVKATGVSLAGVYDPSTTLREGVSRSYGVPFYVDSNSLISDEQIDAVVIAVPDRFHFSLASAALASGKHVLVEKPLAATLEEAQSLANLARDSGLVLQVGAMKRHDPGVRYAEQAIRERIGKVLSANIWYRVMSGLRPEIEHTHFPKMIVDEESSANENTFKLDRANYLLVTHGAHVLDGLRYLLGQPMEICARRANVGPDFTWHGLATLAGDGIASFEITANVHSEWSEGAEIYGENGSVKLGTHFPFLLQASEVEVFEESTGLIQRPIFADTNPYKLQLESFARAVSSGTPPEPNAEDGLAAVQLMVAVSRSISSGGGWVKP